MAPAPTEYAQIPLSPAKNAVFVEDDNGAGADQQVNILQSSARGVVSVIPARGAALGSGFVLAAYHGLPGAGTLTIRLVMSGKTYPAMRADPLVITHLAPNRNA